MSGDQSTSQVPDGSVPPEGAGSGAESPTWIAEPTRQPTEIVIGLVGPLGTDNSKVIRAISERLEVYGYTPQPIRITREIIPAIVGTDRVPSTSDRGFRAAEERINLGNIIRRSTKNPAALAIAVAAEIARRRPQPVDEQVTKTAYIVSSLKLRQEVAELRKVYREGFYLFGVNTSRDLRLKYLMGSDGRLMSEWEAVRLIERDEHEPEEFGQNTRDTFALADFFCANEGNDDKLRFSIQRCLDLVFGCPMITPTFNEFAMFMAFAASLRSADLSRQVGAVLARDNEILSNGANDCPRPGGGLYWPVFIGNRIDDVSNGRDYKRGADSNEVERTRISKRILSGLGCESNDATKVALAPIRDITEYGRVVHAEMEALLACARRGATTVGATMYCTTFPCHNCAKHIIAAGVVEVVYVEPYPKSKALEFHDDAITTTKDAPCEHVVRFKPFIGVGPRKFFDLFSMSLSSGRDLVRKTGTGESVEWDPSTATPRVQMLPVTHRTFEKFAAEYLKQIRSDLKEGNELGGGERKE